MKRFAVAVLIASCLLAGAARAQFGAGQPASGPYPQAVGGPVGSPTYVVPPAQGGGIINIGQAFGPAIQDYVNAIVNALILAGVTYLGTMLHNKLNIDIDAKHRDALVTALQNQAGSLIADGAVKLEQNGNVAVSNAKLADAANEVMRVIPDAAKRLGFTPDYVAARIKDMIPQTAAGAALVAAAQPAPAADAAAPAAPPAPPPPANPA